jgi:hypothetical protein
MTNCPARAEKFAVSAHANIGPEFACFHPANKSGVSVQIQQAGLPLSKTYKSAVEGLVIRENSRLFIW